MPDIEALHMQQLSWPAILRALGQQRSFIQLERYIVAKPIPQLVCVPDDTFQQSDTTLLDLVALHHIPDDTDAGFAPVQIEGNGNCFPQTISYLLSRTENMYTEIKVCIIYEAVLNMGQYLDDNYVSNGAHNLYDRGILPEQYAQYSDNYTPHVAFNMLKWYKIEVLDICSDGAFMGIWQIFQVANVIKRPITSVHPKIGNANIREDLHQTVYCIDDSYNLLRPLKIMWTPMQVNGGPSCHFVPLLRVCALNSSICKIYEINTH